MVCYPERQIIHADENVVGAVDQRSSKPSQWGKRALSALFKRAVSKDVVSRVWRRVTVDWDVWCARSLADEDIIRLILDGTVIKTRLDRKATNILVLAAIGVRRDGQKVLLSITNMGGESTAAWHQILEDLEAAL